MQFKVSSSAGFFLGKVNVQQGMNTPKGPVQKVNASSCYVGFNSEEKTHNEKVGDLDLSIPIWYLTDTEIATIEFSQGKSVETLEPADKAMILLTKEDNNSAVQIINQLAEYHSKIARAKHKEAKANKTEKVAVFDTYLSLDSTATLAAIEKLTS